MVSLQRRFVVGGMLWAIGITVAGTFALLSAFDQISNQRFDAILLERHTQLVVALELSGSPELVQSQIFDPAYNRPYSGRYWQINDRNGVAATSPSLFDWELETPRFDSGLGVFTATGPRAQIRGLAQNISLDGGQKFQVVVAESIASLTLERNSMRRSLALGFGVVGFVGLIGIVSLVSLLLAPLKRLQEDVVKRWDSKKGLQPEEYPAEVAPLVSDINELSRRNTKIIEQGRRQAADLAHVLKTPSAAARNELVELSKTTPGTERMFEALDRIDAQITRSLAKMRASSASNEMHLRTDVPASLDRLVRLFSSVPKTEHLKLQVDCPNNIFVAVDRQDFEEILGNLLDNALAWCETRVETSVKRSEQTVTLTVQDDGPGVEPDLYETVLQEGQRLDSRNPGTGLGLSIASDLVQTYGGSLELGRSENLGGLMVTIVLPSAQMSPKVKE